jgi:long-chain acyl-CoA synthetase
VVEHIHPETTTFLFHHTKNGCEEISYKQVLDKADAISSYFLDLGVQKGDRLALIIENCPEYVYYDQALQQLGAVNVSIYPTLSETEIAYILNDAGAKMILVGNPFLLKKILKIANTCPQLIRIIPVFEGYEKHVEGQSINAGVLSLAELIAEGEQSLAEHK